MQDEHIAFVKVQARKVRDVKGKRVPSSYMVTIPKEAVDALEIRNRNKEEKVRVLLYEESRRLVYQF